MFALIISILAIILAVALAGVSVYYGGDAFSNGSERAAAATLTNQGAQIEAASTLFRAENGESAVAAALTAANLTTPDTTLDTWQEQLTVNNYLKQIPVSATGNAFDIDSGYVVTTGVGSAVCEAFDNSVLYTPVTADTFADVVAAVATTPGDLVINDDVDTTVAPFGISGCLTYTDNETTPVTHRVFYYSL